MAREVDFKAFATSAARAVLALRPTTVDALLAAKTDSGATLDEVRRALIAKIGENISVRRFDIVESPVVIGAYLHGSRIGALVSLKKGEETVAKDIAMHVAAINPPHVSAADIPADQIAKEQEIHVEQTKADPKTGWQARRDRCERWSKARSASG